MKHNRILVIGCGRLGSNIAIYLSNQGKDVTVLDKDERAFNKINDTFNGSTLLGDATDLEYLQNIENLDNLKEVVIVTENDNTNIFLADYFALVLDIPNIVVRITDVEKGQLIEHMGIKILYPFKSTFDEFIAYEDRSNI
ncbi:MAG: NAD-binding protein [Acholeplasma sp.]